MCVEFVILALIAVFLIVAMLNMYSAIGDTYKKDYEGAKGRALDRQKALAELSGFSRQDGSVVGEAGSPLSGLNNSLHISAVDMFVEIAQETLISRKKRMDFFAMACVAAFFISVVVFEVSTGAFTYIKDVIFNADALKSAKDQISILTWPSVFYIIARNGSALAIFLFILYFFVSLFRAFLHESTILENRIHSIRLGRLFYYTKFLGAADGAAVARIASKITAEEIEKVFGWNIETSTAFKDINPELVSRGVFSQIAAAIAGLIKKK